MTFRQFHSHETLNRPWAIVRILPKAQRYVVTRFRNRQDADDHLRVLHRFIPTATFEIVFDPSDETD